ncbi:hypothetical protein BGZ51_008074 [Haplosporangium sp. Z 767]|nr:hypothetical protein BGZ51_008074 [Haplosporangium sp. Z 767]KAF9193080.1 hypothetical protein BGZ50_007928 [Haplosporangium sp. Z 11]
MINDRDQPAGSSQPSGPKLVHGSSQDYQERSKRIRLLPPSPPQALNPFNAPTINALEGMFERVMALANASKRASSESIAPNAHTTSCSDHHYRHIKLEGRPHKDYLKPQGHDTVASQSTGTRYRLRNGDSNSGPYVRSMWSTLSGPTQSAVTATEASSSMSGYRHLLPPADSVHGLHDARQEPSQRKAEPLSDRPQPQTVIPLDDTPVYIAASEPVSTTKRARSPMPIEGADEQSDESVVELLSSDEEEEVDEEEDNELEDHHHVFEEEDFDEELEDGEDVVDLMSEEDDVGEDEVESEHIHMHEANSVDEYNEVRQVHRRTQAPFVEGLKDGVEEEENEGENFMDEEDEEGEEGEEEEDADDDDHLRRLRNEQNRLARRAMGIPGAPKEEVSLSLDSSDAEADYSEEEVDIGDEELEEALDARMAGEEIGDLDGEGMEGEETGRDFDATVVAETYTSDSDEEQLSSIPLVEESQLERASQSEHQQGTPNYEDLSSKNIVLSLGSDDDGAEEPDERGPSPIEDQDVNETEQIVEEADYQEELQEEYEAVDQITIEGKELSHDIEPGPAEQIIESKHPGSTMEMEVEFKEVPLIVDMDRSGDDGGHSTLELQGDSLFEPALGISNVAALTTDVIELTALAEDMDMPVVQEDLAQMELAQVELAQVELAQVELAQVELIQKELIQEEPIQEEHTQEEHIQEELIQKELAVSRDLSSAILDDEVHEMNQEKQPPQHHISLMERLRAVAREEGIKVPPIPDPLSLMNLALEGTPILSEDPSVSEPQAQSTNDLGIVPAPSEPRRTRLMRYTTINETVKEGKAFIEQAEARSRANKMKEMSATLPVTNVTDETEEDAISSASTSTKPEESTHTPVTRKAASSGNASTSTTGTKYSSELKLLVEEARAFCSGNAVGRMSSSPGSIGASTASLDQDTATQYAQTPSRVVTVEVPSSTYNHRRGSSLAMEMDNEGLVTSAEPENLLPSHQLPSTAPITPQRSSVVDLVAENVIQSKVVGNHSLRPFIHPPSPVGSAVGSGNGLAGSRSNSLEPNAIPSPSRPFQPSAFTFGQTPLGISGVSGSKSPSVTGPLGSPSVGFGFGTSFVAIPREKKTAGDSPSYPAKRGTTEVIDDKKQEGKEEDDRERDTSPSPHTRPKPKGSSNR